LIVVSQSQVRELHRRVGRQIRKSEKEDVNMKNVVLAGLAIAAIGLVAPQPVRAANISINDAVGETIVFSLNDFEGGFILDGMLVQQGLNNPVTVTVNELNAAGVPIVHTFSADWVTAGAIVPQNMVVAFPEAGVPPTQGVSDILTFIYSVGPRGGHLSGSFVSDGESLLPLPPGALMASGESFVFNNTNITASATSDVDVVPEPTSLLLLGTGFVGFAFSIRKRRSAS
jgi:hypothetical protein